MAVYRRWLDDLAHEEWLDFAVVQLPGRDKRLLEPACTDLEMLLESLESAMMEVADLPLVLFGCSMGAMLAYETALRLVMRGVVPQHLIVAARVPPYRIKPRNSRLVLDREQVIAKIRRLGGTAPQLIDSDFFESHVFPMLQADFAMVDNHHRAFPHILPCPVLALAGRQDPDVTIDQVRAWSLVAGRGFELDILGGDHFFLHSAHEQVIEIVNNVLARYAPNQQVKPTASAVRTL
jgi:surfactin synthase thioesterase subunit